MTQINVLLIFVAVLLGDILLLVAGEVGTAVLTIIVLAVFLGTYLAINSDPQIKSGGS